MDARALKQMIANAIGSVRQGLRGRLQRASAARQVILVQAEGLAGETFNDAELFQQPGLRSVPVAGMQTIVIPLGGRSANGVVVAMSNGALFVTGLQPGEIALFNESEGVANSIVLRNGKLIEINCATLTINATAGVNITTPAVTITADTTDISGDTHIGGDVGIDGATHIAGNATVDQTVAAAVDITAAGKSLKAHTHGGVAAGVASSGVNQ